MNEEMENVWKAAVVLLELLFGTCLHGLRQATKILVR
jgi:hypothetical protein